MKVDPVDLGQDVGAWITRRAGTLSSGSLAPAGNLSHHRPHRPADLARDRASVAELIGQPAARWHFMRQVHGDRIRVVDDAASEGEQLGDVDGAVTRLFDRPLVVTVADCLPVLVAGDETVGVAHAGRQGLVAGVLTTLITAFTKLGEAPWRLRAVIGPSIGPCCYEVPAAMRADVARRHPAAFSSTTWGSPSVDLAAAATVVLQTSGLDRVTRVAGCTMCDPARRWFSHRDDAGTGRFAGIIVRRRAQAPQGRIG